jgi:hypothetical protein
MPVCHKRKIVFCHVPRTGGVSICLTLELAIEDRHEKASYLRGKYPGYHLFSIYRPYKDRIESALGYSKETAGVHSTKKESYEDIVDSIIIAKGNGISVKPNDYFLDVPVDTLLQYNDLENELNKMLVKLGHKAVKLIQSNSRRKK